MREPLMVLLKPNPSAAPALPTDGAAQPLSPPGSAAPAPDQGGPPGWQVHLALLFVQLCFGGFHVAARATVRHLSPLTLAGLRVALATPLLMAQALAVDRRLPAPRHLPHLALLGLMGVTVNQLLYLLGIRRTTASNAAILIPSVPAFTALVAWLLRMERVGGGKLAGVLISMAGALLLLRPHRFSAGDETALGNSLVLLNCLSYAGFLVYQRKLHSVLPWRTIIAWTFLLGGIGVWTVSIGDVLAADLSAVPWQGWAGLLYIVVFPTFLSYGINTWAVGRSSSVLVAAYTTLQPLVASLLARLILGEQLGWVEVASFALLVTGLWKVNRG